MSIPQIRLDLAAFLSSPEAESLDGIDRDMMRKIIEVFLTVCYEDLAKKPHRLDGHDVHAAFCHLLPGRLGRKDPVAPHAPAVISAYFRHLETVQMVPQAYEIRRELDRSADEFLEAVRTGKNVHHAPPERQDPFVHKAPKLGRNDPCSCGSGKKFKKCHGKNL